MGRERALNHTCMWQSPSLFFRYVGGVIQKHLRDTSKPISWIGAFNSYKTVW